jgi:outer membrane protein OmpA-like peptidoglycan-associated protein
MMFAVSTRESAKTKTKAAPGSPGPQPASPNSADVNPLWQSLAIRSGVLQPRLTIGQADDPYEREADRVADQVMRMPAPNSDGNGLSITPVTAHQAQRKCAECEDEEEEGKLQRKESGGAEVSATAPPTVHQTLSSPGQRLDAATRAYFEPRFGRDFSGVRIHTGDDAVSATHDARARAFTVANQIAFAAGQYEPSSEAGRRLLAHELTHVAQQERLGHSSEKMLLQREPIEGDTACFEPPLIDTATGDFLTQDCVMDRRDPTVWAIRLWDFELAKDTLTPCHKAAIDLLISDINDVLEGDPEITGWSITRIVGHASPEGGEEYNENLALRRAEAVFSELGTAVSGALPAPVSSGTRCGEGAPRAYYPYFRAVDVTVEFSGESPRPPYLVPGRGNQTADRENLEGMTTPLSMLRVRCEPGSKGKIIGKLAFESMHVQITDQKWLEEEDEKLWFKVIFSPEDLTTIRQQPLTEEEQLLATSDPCPETWVGESAFGYVAMRYDKFLELVDAFDADCQKKYPKERFRDRLTRLRQIGEDKNLGGDEIIGHGSELPGRVVRDDREVVEDWSLLLEAKQVIMPNSEIIDIHHFITGLDALASPPEQQWANYEAKAGIYSGESYSNTTWSGDVGAAVGEYVYYSHYKDEKEWEKAHPTATNLDRVKIYFETSAPDQDLLADIDAWGVYKNVPKTAKDSSSFYTLRGLIVSHYGEGTPDEESVKEYESRVAEGREAGIREFLCHYGFSSPTDLYNQSVAKDRVKKQVELFGRVWYRKNIYSGPSWLRQARQLRLGPETDQDLSHASEMMTVLFLMWLEDLANKHGITSIDCDKLPEPKSTLEPGHIPQDPGL